MSGYSRLTLFAPCSPICGAGMALLAGWGGHAFPCRDRCRHGRQSAHPCQSASPCQLTPCLRG